MYYKTLLFQNDGKVPASLYQTCALMVQHGILKMDAVYSMLGPEDSSMFEAAEKEEAEAKEFVRKMGVVSINKDKSTNGDEKMDVDSSSAASVSKKSSW